MAAEVDKLCSMERGKKMFLETIIKIPGTQPTWSCSSPQEHLHMQILKNVLITKLKTR